MLTIIHPQIITRHQIIDALAKVRQEWEQAASGDCLIDVKGSVGLLLADLVVAIGLEPSEQVEALGADLVDEMQGILMTNPDDNGNH